MSIFIFLKAKPISLSLALSVCLSLCVCVCARARMHSATHALPSINFKRVSFFMHHLLLVNSLCETVYG